MKQFLFSLAVISLLVACNQSKKTDLSFVSETDTAITSNVDTISEAVEQGFDVDFDYRVCDITPDEFNILAAYIEKYGFEVSEKGVPCDHQYTFIDKNANRHALITIRRDSLSNPSLKAPITQISVWAYYKGVKDYEHFFGYTIHPDAIYQIGSKSEDKIAIENGYRELLKRIKG